MDSVDIKKAKLLIADDDQIVRTTISKLLQMFGYEVEAVESGIELVNKLNDSYDVIILDINMPDMDGFETMEKINKMDLEIPVLFLTGASSMDYVIKAINIGAYDFLTKPIDDLDVFNIKIKRAVEKRSFVLKERKYKESLEDDVRAKAEQLEQQNRLLVDYSHSLESATIQLMTSLQNAMEEKDFYTAGHTMRVTEYAVMLGLAMGLSENDLSVLRRASQFHDVGKLVIDCSCIQKAGPLNDEEWQLIKKHPEVGANIIKPLGFMDREGDIIRHHHERMDGKGYPDGLKEDQLCELTKIITIVDSYDAMTSKRNYRENMTMEQAVEELHACSGTQFDKEIVDYFSRSIVDFTPIGSFSTDRSLEGYLDDIGI